MEVGDERLQVVGGNGSGLGDLFPIEVLLQLSEVAVVGDGGG